MQEFTNPIDQKLQGIVRLLLEHATQEKLQIIMLAEGVEGMHGAVACDQDFLLEFVASFLRNAPESDKKDEFKQELIKLLQEKD